LSGIAWEGKRIQASSKGRPLILDSIVGAHLAASQTSRVVAAILIGPVYPSPSLRPIFEKRIQAVEKDGMQPMADSVPQAAVGARASPLVKAFIRELLLAQDPAGYISNCRVIVNAKAPKYGEISVPVLILAGSEDKSAPMEGCKKMFEEIGTGEKRLEVLGGVGHWHCLEAHEEVVEKIVGFYESMQ
jgi:pimeloyl-ACP methyl ester carboxylesterase